MKTLEHNSLAQAVISNAELLQEKIAIVDKNGCRKTTWKEFGTLIEKIADYAKLLGLKGVVPVVQERSMEYVATILGLNLAGVAVSPLSDDYPKERIDYIKKDLASDVIADAAFVKAAKAHSIKAHSFSNDPNSIAWVIFTSGSTGHPKGVVYSNSALSFACSVLVDFNKLNDSSISASNASFSFCASLVDLYAPLCCGAVVHILSDECRKDSFLLEDYLFKHSINFTFLSPRMLANISADLPDMKLITIGGEKASNISPRRYQIGVVYGMTETLALASYFIVDKKYDNTPIGKAVNGKNIYLLDQDGKLSDEGEICISGVIAEGYWNLPALTAKVFTDNPFSDDPKHKKLLHTGDLARRLPDGNLLFLNRNDWMLKINGQRVEPEEIEHQIKAIEGVSEAVVKGFENANSQVYLCAWFSADNSIAEAEVRAKLADVLPSYMMPAFVIKLDAFPINTNGKLDRKALSSPDATSFLAAYEAPINEVEIGICEGFQKILGIERIGRNDDFFALGGDSILAIKLCTELKAYCLQSSQLFAARTPKGIAQIIKISEQNTTQVIDNQQDNYPLTAGQLGVYFASMASPESLEYNLPFDIKLPQETDTDRLRKAIEEVLNAYPAFGVRFQVIDGQPCMVKREPYIEIESVEVNDAEIKGLKDKFIRPFDIEKGELARFLIAKTERALHLLIDIHHIIFDGSSVGIFLNALSVAYKGEDIPKENISLFQAASIEQNADSSMAHEFFKKQLNANDFESSLPSDTVQDGRGENKATGKIIEYKFDEISNKVEYFARKSGITEATVFMGAFAWAFSKMIGTNDIAFCTVENGRSTSEYDGTIAMLVKTLPLCISLDESVEPSTYLSNLGKLFYETLANDSYPFYKLAKEFGVNNDTMFVYQSEMLDNLSFSDSPVQVKQLDTRYALSKLSVSVYKTKGRYKASISYRSDLYSINKIQTLCSLMQAALSGFIDGLALKDIPLCNDADIRLLESFHGEDTTSDNDSVVDMLRHAMKLYPDNIAIVSGKTKLTYKELDEITDRTAAFLVSKGIGREDVVAILTDRNEMMATFPIAVAKTGAMYQPLDSSYPAERLTYMVKDSGAKLLITPKHLRQLVETDVETFYTEDVVNIPDNNKVLPIVKPDDAFVILYTSGSTGLPKGCILEHRNLRSYIDYHIKSLNLNSESKIAAYASFGFDASLLDFFPALCAGASVYIIAEDIRLDLELINRYYEDNSITHAFLTTQLGRQFACTMHNKRLKYLSTGGEALINIRPSEDYTIVNMYGPSETTIAVCLFKIDKFYHLPPIGKAFDNVNLYVLDPYMRRVPVGVSGELYIAGPQVARGYLNLPEKTAQSFIDNPFSDNPKYKRMYRTGDIVAFLPDGNVQFVGRKDAQVKIRGFRIELSEIEEVIKRFKGIKNATVIAVDNKESEKFIAAYVVSDETVDIDQLNDFIRSEKPAYMVPAVTMQIDEIPLTANHKVNKKALPTPIRKMENILQAQNETQQKIFDLVAEVLGYKEFGINTDLEYAGLSSISSVKLLSLLSKAFDRALSIKDLKENNTIERLEKLLSEEQKQEDFELRDEYPLTKTQEGIFFECMNKPDSTFYNVPYLIELGGGVDLEKLKDAIVRTINAHPYLLTRLSLTDEGVRCNRDTNAHFQISDIEEIRVDTTEGLSASLCKAFKLQGGALLRIALIYSKENTLLYLDFHHIIFDGSSLAIFIEDINRAYSGENLEIERYSGYEAALNEQYLRSTVAFEKAKNYYNGLFEDHSETSLPYGDYPDNSGCSSCNYTLQNFSKNDVDAFCKTAKLSKNTVFTAALGFLLAKYKDDTCATFTTVYNGRNDSRLARSISMYVKTYPVLCDISQKNIREYLNGLAKQIDESRLNDIYSFAEIHADLGINADIMLVYQDGGFESDTFCGEKLLTREVQIDTEKAPLSISISLKRDKINLDVEYDASKYTKEYVEAFIHSYELALIGIVSKQELNDIELVDNKALAKLDSFHGEDIEQEKCSVVDMLRSAMKRYPDKIAIVNAQTKIRYKALDEITDKLAAYIISQGIGKEDAVAILADRDEFMAICPIAVIKAGAMYVPLDSSYPSDRLTFMVKDSGAKLLITPKNLRGLIEAEVETFFTEDIKNLPKSDTIQPIVKPEDAFVMLYTSGSTGKPKGCILEHSNFVAYCKFYHERFKYSETCATAAYAGFGFDANMQDIFTTLCAGASLHIIPFDMRLELHNLNQYLEANKITHIFMTTQIGRQFAISEENHSLKYLILGGEALTPINAIVNYTIVNGYGPSETCCGVSFFDLDRMYKSVPLGKPNTNVKAYIVDKQFRRVPIGVPGELCIAGPQVSRGYLNLPEKTAEVFIENPFCDDAKYKRMYRTGDIICFLPDGNLQFFGRKDAQVKIRGFRIELPEIEEVISRFEGIKDCTVVDFDNPDGGKFLAAYVVSDYEVDIEKLNAFILSEKPSYMVPAVTMQIDSIPLTQNQKVNRKALPKPVVSSRKEYIQPQNKIEEDFCEIMGETLGINRYSATDSFFELGGSSISASKVLIGAVAKGYKIAYPDLFRYPSPRDLATFINSAKTAKSNDDIVNYDYSKINKLLSAVNIAGVDDAISRDFSILNNKLGNVLLTGVTGFLGIHILYVYLKGYSGNITCLIRNKENLSHEDWLKALLVFYFSNDCSEVFDQSRIKFVEASINDDDLDEKLQDVDFDTLIHCAASVSHFASDDVLYRVNTEGTKNVLRVCEAKKKRFIHISTGSVSGLKNKTQFKDSFNENDLFIDQKIDNDYIRTKFLAERYVLEAATRGADVKILRVGNLTSRYHDGEFQINFSTNAFMRNLRGVLALGYSSVDLEDKKVNISPIDCTAEAALAIADSNLPAYIYHVYNDKYIKLSEMTKTFQESGFPMQIVSEMEYRRQIELAAQKYKDDATKSDIIAGLIAYKDAETGTELEPVETINDFTSAVLFRLGFTWPKIEKWYIKQMIQIMVDMGFFEKNDAIGG